MTVPSALLLTCFVVMMLVGIYIVIWSLVRLTKSGNAPAQVNLPGLKIQVKGPAWLIVTLVGAVLVASPVIAAALQRPSNVTQPPPSVRDVQKLDEPNYSSFRFVRDVSILDLRSSLVAPWYTNFPGLKKFFGKQKIRPAILKNYMTLRKIQPVDKIHINYSTTGTLDVKCLTNPAEYNKSKGTEDGKQVETWEVVVDVSSIPVNQEFELIIEATYWNAFSGESGDDYTTYSHDQTEAEEISTVLLFPPEKPFKTVECQEYVGKSQDGRTCQGIFREYAGAQNRTYYRVISNGRGTVYFRFAWAW